MTDDRIRDPLEKSDEEASSSGTSGSREETMDDSGEQDPGESGTTSMGGESSDSTDIKGPGGVEGTS